MNYRWQIDEGTAESQGAEDRRGAPAAGSVERLLAADRASGFRIARRRLLMVAAISLALVGLVVAGWRYWKGRELLAQIRSDVRAAVELEERAQAEGDTELYLRQQSRSRERLVNRQLSRPEHRQAIELAMMSPPLGSPESRMARKPPLPGLRAEDAAAVIQAIEPETDTPAGQPIRRAAVEVLTRHSDALGQATFVETRPYVLSDRGRWIHTTHPEELAEAEPERWEGHWLDARYLPADAEILVPILEGVEDHLARFCAAVDDCRQEPIRGEPRRLRVRLAFLGDVQGRGGRHRDDGGFARLLPAPALTLRPSTRDSADLYMRHILRLAILDILEQHSGDGLRLIDGFAQPEEDLQRHERLIPMLVDAWLAQELGIELPQPRPWPATHFTFLLPRLWDTGTYALYPNSAGGQAALRHFAAYLAGRSSPDSLVQLLLDLPTSRDAESWLESSLDVPAAELLEDWEISGPRFPADRELLVGCWLGRWEQLLFQPDRSGPRVLRRELCGGQDALDAVWHPDGQGLALNCGRLHGDPNRIGSGPEARLLWLRDLDAEDSEPKAMIPAGGEAIWPRAPHWTADGRWLVWSTLADDQDARVWAMPATAEAWTRGVEARQLVGRSRWIEDGPENPQIAPAQRDPLRPSPVGSAIAFEAPGRRISVVDLMQSGPVERWSAIGSDPVWSPDGAGLAVLRFDPGLPMGRVELVLLDASDGSELAASNLDLAGLAAEAAQSFRGPSPAAVAERWQVRLRVGAWSPDARRASLVAATRIEHGTSTTRQWSGTGDYDWLAVSSVDVEEAGAVQDRVPAEVYIDARREITRWLDDDRTLAFLHVDPLLLTVYRDRDDLPEGDVREVPIASFLDLDSGVLRALDADALVDYLGIEGIDALSVDDVLSSRGLPKDWQIRMGRQEDGESNWGEVQLEIWSKNEDEPRWTLPTGYCRDIAWRPESDVSATRPAAGR